MLRRPFYIYIQAFAFKDVSLFIALQCPLRPHGVVQLLAWFCISPGELKQMRVTWLIYTSQHFSGQVALFLGPVKKVSAKLTNQLELDRGWGRYQVQSQPGRQRACVSENKAKFPLPHTQQHIRLANHQLHNLP